MFYKFLQWLNTYVEAPKFYGFFHLMCLFIIASLCVGYWLIQRKFKSEKIFKTTLLVSWIILVTFEIFKELSMALQYDTAGNPFLSYAWWTFPYQFCSLPFYFLPVIIFVKNEKVKEFFVSATVSFVLIGAVLILAVPGTFTTIAYINVQTMVHHGLQFFTSFACILFYKDKFSLKHFAKGAMLVTCAALLAIPLNVIIYNSTGQPIQLWNLSPVYPCDAEFLENIKQTIGFVPYVIYTLQFSL